MKLVLIADSNISHLSTYFTNKFSRNSGAKSTKNSNDRKQASLGSVELEVISMAGRDINAEVLNKYQPHGLLIRSVTQVNQELLMNNSSVKFIGSATIGTDHVDIDYLQQRDIYFSNAAGCSKHSVAQYVLSAILTLRPEYASFRSSNTEIAERKISLEPPKIGIIGLGNIGSSLAFYAQNLGWQVLGYDPLLAREKLNNSSFTEVLQNADIISLHVPLTTVCNSAYPTHHLLAESELEQLQKHALLINSARGEIIKEQALVVDIKQNQRQVVLDVFENEPVISRELLSLLAIATPHIAGYTLEGKVRGTQIIHKAFCDCFNLEVQNKFEQESLVELLPANNLVWHELLRGLQYDTSKLKDYYDIMVDDELIRRLDFDNKQNIIGSDFDALRKNYRLRREWLTC